MKRLIPAVAAAVFCLATAMSYAQDAGKGPMRENMKAAHEACKDKPDHRACMTESMCSKAPDPAKCQANAKERQAKKSKHMDERQAAAEACTGKRGDDLRKCYREQHEKSRGMSDKKG